MEEEASEHEYSTESMEGEEASEHIAEERLFMEAGARLPRRGKGLHVLQYNNNTINLCYIVLLTFHHTALQWAEPRLLSRHDWKFSKLEDAFKDGGLLHREENVFLFTCSEPLGVFLDGQPTALHAPVIVVIVSTFSPSDKMAIAPVQGGLELASIVDMEKVDMSWVPCSIPLRQRGETPLTQISVMSYVQNLATSNGIELGPSSHFCFPYLDNPSKAKQSTVVDVVFPAEGEPIVVDRFNWSYNMPEVFTDRLINEGKLSIDHKVAFKAFLKEKVKQAKRANKEAIQALEELKRTDEKVAEKVAAFENMRFYKFYPDNAPAGKTSCINYYYGNAHRIF